MTLKDDYFIIESLGPHDVKDGIVFADGIRSTGEYQPTHRTVNTPEEFEAALIEFSQSDYRHLFISAHGNKKQIGLNDGGRYNAADLGPLAIDLHGRRIFMSTCKGGSVDFGREFIRKGAYSVIGAPDNIDQIVATGLWVTMVCIFRRFNENRVTADYEALNNALEQLAKVYYIELAYYSFRRKDKTSMKEYIYFPEADKKRTNYAL